MPLQRNHIEEPLQEKKHSIDKKKWIRRGKRVGLTFAILIGLAGAYAGYLYYEGAKISAQASKSQESILTNKNFKIASEAKGKYAYADENDGIPNATQLLEYQELSTPMTTWGFAAAPAQAGLSVPIKVLPINEGVSNQTLSWGYGTVKPGYKMGMNNNILAAHNFADGVTYASPLQAIDVSQRPKFYQTDGKKLYTYELTDKQLVGAVSREYTDAVQQSVVDKVTLVTCYLPGGIYTPDPSDRVVVSGKLLNTMDYSKASQDIKSLFPNFK